MIDIKHIVDLGATDKVVEFMAQYGGSHVSLYKGWEECPSMGKIIFDLEQQLHIALVVKKSLNMSKRIAGRIRKLNAEEEDLAMARACGEENNDVVDLGCLG